MMVCLRPFQASWTKKLCNRNRGLTSYGEQKHVDFVNLMTYDLFGSWDKESNWIGPYVYGHTNLTVIKQALNLLWRNGVPANQVNLGLGFYGR